MEAHIIGGGIAGLTAAYALSGEAGEASAKCKVLLWEKENLPCKMSSSRNAAIFRTYESDPTLSNLVKESFIELLKIEKISGKLLDRRGLLINPLELDYYEKQFVERHSGVEGLYSHPGTLKLPDESNFSGLLIPDNGIIDIHGLQDFLLRQSKDVTVNFNSEITEVTVENNRIIELKTNETKYILPEDSIVINATGAWAAEIAKKSNILPPPISPYKRHLFFIQKDRSGSEKDFPVIWDEKRDVYLRPEGNGLLGTHCDQREAVPGDYTSSEKEVHRFLESVTSVFPFLKDYHISRYWACLRTFSLDQHPVVGFDPVIENLFWLAGLGGRGMTIAPGLISVIRKLVFDKDFFNPYSPVRFY
jgi:D-arginine dehydrogenase